MNLSCGRHRTILIVLYDFWLMMNVCLDNTKLDNINISHNFHKYWALSMQVACRSGISQHVTTQTVRTSKVLMSNKSHTLY